MSLLIFRLTTHYDASHVITGESKSFVWRGGDSFTVLWNGTHVGTFPSLYKFCLTDWFQITPGVSTVHSCEVCSRITISSIFNPSLGKRVQAVQFPFAWLRQCHWCYILFNAIFSHCFISFGINIIIPYLFFFIMNKLENLRFCFSSTYHLYYIPAIYCLLDCTNIKSVPHMQCNIIIETECRSKL